MVIVQALLFVLPTYTALPSDVHLKACVAVTLVCSQHVLTHTVMTDVRVQGTLVNIWGGQALR